jgi:acyl dehydratase
MQSFKTTFSNLSELQNYLDQEIGVSPWHVITQEDINTFARVTHDEQWIHTDLERSRKESPYGTTIAHGFFVLSLASKFAFECYTIEDVKMGINYGLDRVRFPNATPVNANIRGRLLLMEYKAIRGGAQFKVQITFEIEGQKKPACVAEFIGRAYT